MYTYLDYEEVKLDTYAGWGKQNKQNEWVETESGR